MNHYTGITGVIDILLLHLLDVIGTSGFDVVQ